MKTAYKRAVFENSRMRAMLIRKGRDQVVASSCPAPQRYLCKMFLIFKEKNSVSFIVANDGKIN
jgi:hypothetical protein